MDWNVTDYLIGQRVVIFTAYDEEEEATFIGVNDTGETIMVKTDDDEILVNTFTIWNHLIFVGDQWEHAE